VENAKIALSPTIQIEINCRLSPPIRPAPRDTARKFFGRDPIDAGCFISYENTGGRDWD